MVSPVFGTEKPTYDPTLGDLLAGKLIYAAQLGSTDVLLQELEPIRSGRWDDRLFYFSIIGANLKNIERVRMLPDTAPGNLIKALVAMRIGGEARGTGTADTVTEESWKIFFQYYDMAGQFLVRAGAQDAEDPTPFALLQSIATGLSLERAQSVKWLNEAIRRDPYNRAAHFGHMDLLCEKWGGSHDEMFTFARDTVKKAPPGSLVNTILYHAFQEYFLYFLAFDNNPKYTGALLQNKMIRDESFAVYEKALKDRNIERPSDCYPHNLAVWWFSKLGVPDVVQREARKLGPRFTQHPWKIFHKDPAEAYFKATIV